MSLPLFLPCAAGVEALLAEEVARLLPDATVRAARGGVGLAGDPHEVMVLNLESRLAQRVLIEVGEGPYRDEDDLYALAHDIAWSDWITPRQTLRVDSTAQRSPLRSLNFAALRIKDAVCDRMRDEHGVRPNVDTDVLSPGQSQTLTYTLPKGTYAEMCFFPDLKTGMPHAAMGMVRIVHLK